MTGYEKHRFAKRNFQPNRGLCALIVTGCTAWLISTSTPLVAQTPWWDGDDEDAICEECRVRKYYDDDGSATCCFGENTKISIDIDAHIDYVVNHCNYAPCSEDLWTWREGQGQVSEFDGDFAVATGLEPDTDTPNCTDWFGAHWSGEATSWMETWFGEDPPTIDVYYMTGTIEGGGQWYIEIEGGGEFISFWSPEGQDACNQASWAEPLVLLDGGERSCDPPGNDCPADPIVCGQYNLAKYCWRPEEDAFTIDVSVVGGTVQNCTDRGTADDVVNCDDLEDFVAQCDPGDDDRDLYLETIYKFFELHNAEWYELDCQSIIDCVNGIIVNVDPPDDYPLTPTEETELALRVGCANEPPDPPQWDDTTNEGDGGIGNPGHGECGNGGNDGLSDNPVDLYYGHKVETVADLVISATGDDFTITRQVTSQSGFAQDLGNPNMVGNNWGLSPFMFLRTDASVYSVSWPPVQRRRIYEGPNQDDIYEPVGASAQTLETGFDATDDVCYAKISEPGEWDVYFYSEVVGTPPGECNNDDVLEGLLWKQEDKYGHVRKYDYWLVGDEIEYQARLKSIRFEYGTSTGPAVADVEARFLWNWGTDEALYGKLAAIQVYRLEGAQEPYLVQEVEYTYMPTTPGNDFHGDLGTAGDLVQVVQRERVDRKGGATSPWHARITQYRYHDNGSVSGPQGDDRYALWGNNSQIKAIIQPQQIEYFAQKRNEARQTPLAADKALAEAATYLLTCADAEDLSDDLWTGALTFDLASKIFSYFQSGGNQFTDGDSHGVQYQFLQADCGCGGGSAQGTRLSYEYFETNDKYTIKITEDLYDEQSGSFDDTYRYTYFDLEDRGDDLFLPYLVNKAVVDAADTDQKWVWHYKYDQDSNQVIQVCQPSAMQAYTPATSTVAWSYTSHDDEGLIHEYEYNDEYRHTKLYVRNGAGVSVTPVLVSETVYPTQNQTFLPSTTKRYTDETDQTSENIETTTYDYGFWSTGGDARDLAWIETTIEAETESENGPSSSTEYSTVQLFDEVGHTEWQVDALGVLTRYEYDEDIDRLTRIVRNSEPPTSWASYPGLPQGYGDWGPPAGDDSGPLVSEFDYNGFGDRIAQESSGGPPTYSFTDMRTEDVAHPNILYKATTSLPPLLNDDTVGGLASITWEDAAGTIIRRSTYTIDPESYEPWYRKYELVDEVTRETITYQLSGLVAERKVWPDYKDRSTLVDVTTYTYDALGRVKSTESPTGTIERIDVYDVLDRPLRFQIGTDDGLSGDMVTTREVFYDFDHGESTGNPEQGLGDGNVTYVRLHTGEDSGTEYRDILYTFDWRNRQVKIINPEPPHSFTVYDNQDRVIKAGTFSSVPDDIDDPLLDRGSYSETRYSQRGLVYKQFVLADPTESVSSGDKLESNLWYDGNGRTVAEWHASSPGLKRTFDAHGRVVSEFVTDRGGDTKPGGTSNYSYATGLTGDVVFEQTTNHYIAGDEENEDPDADQGKLYMTVRRQIAHDSTWVSSNDEDLSHDNSEDAITTYSTIYYDDAGRQIRSVQYGTNNSEGFVVGESEPSYTPNSPPDPDDTDATTLVYATYYDIHGRTDYLVASDGHITKFMYDGSGRRIAVIDNYNQSDPPTIAWNGTSGRYEVADGLSFSNPDENRVTTTVYGVGGRVEKEVAHLADSSDNETVQVTQYHYGTTLPGGTPGATDSLVASNDLLAYVAYPDPGDDGEAGDTEEFWIEYSYNRLGEKRSVSSQEDPSSQTRTTHTYERDEMGRVVTDEVISFRDDVDDTVEEIRFEYDDFGRRTAVRSYDDSDTVLNAAEFGYTTDGEIDYVDQDHNGDADYGEQGSNTLRVDYAYEDAPVHPLSARGNYRRLKEVTYPDGTRKMIYDYGTDASTSGRINRVQSIKTNSANLVDYEYIGMNRFAVVDYVGADVQLDRTLWHDGKRRAAGFTSGDFGEYPGWDRYGRLVRQVWADGALNYDNSSVPNVPPIVELEYGYDNASNRTKRTDARPGAKIENRDFRYTYDGLRRLTEAERGADEQSWSYGTRSQAFLLDELGNWREVYTDTSGNGSYTETLEKEEREHNEANELIERDPVESGGPSIGPYALTYDVEGNLVKETHSASSTLYTHDAWNRLVRIEIERSVQPPEDPITIAEFEYNGLNWRIVKRADTDIPVDGLDEERKFTYSTSWQLLEERIDEDYQGAPGLDSGAQYYWGLRYIDDAIVRRVDEDGNDSIDKNFFYLTDALFTPIAVVRANGLLMERLTYDSYGHARHHWPDDLDGDGDVDIDDEDLGYDAAGKSIGHADYNVDADINRDGIVNASDLALFNNPTVALPSGFISNPDTVGSPIGYAGYIFNSESSNYTVRHRHYDPILGRWLERDPAGYVDILNMYQSFGSRPLAMTDPMGLFHGTVNEHHGYPLYLGGSPNGPRFEMPVSNHKAAHRYFAEQGFDWRGGKGDAARDAWKALPRKTQEMHIRNSLRRAGVSNNRISQNLDAMFENATAGEKQGRIRRGGFTTRGTIRSLAGGAAVMFGATLGYDIYLHSANALGEFAAAVNLCKEIQDVDRDEVVGIPISQSSSDKRRYHYVSRSGVVHEVTLLEQCGNCYFGASYIRTAGNWFTGKYSAVEWPLHPKIGHKCVANTRDPGRNCRPY